MDLKPIPLSRWSGSERRPFVIAGPCAAESQEQLLETARRLPRSRIDYLRAGIWKARTRPNNFEGIGAPALEWLVDAGRELGVKTSTEVATAAHVEAALAAGVDLIWIGARTTVNPFSVQEIANALRGVDVPVLVKNPTSPDLPLWMGAIERIYGAGIRAIGGIHRGFSAAGEVKYRNRPMWQLVIELRRVAPELPIICDPSHIAGRRDLIQPLCQEAMDLGLEGLMVETHRDPDQAWSDAAQQVTPERLEGILSQLHIRRRAGAGDTSLEELRERVDQWDTQLLALLAERMRVVEGIGEWKRTSNVTALQVERWQTLLQDRMQRAGDLGLDPDYVKELYEVIHRESVRRQSEILEGEGD